MKKLIKIDGMGCTHCIDSVSSALSKLDDVKVLEVKIGEATIEVPEDYNMKTITQALDDIGYEVL